MASEAHVGVDTETERAPRAIEQAIATLAMRQHGVVSAGQLRAIGLGASAVKHRARTGRLHRLHRGVYAVGHRALRHEAWWMAAVLAAGDGAVLSHRSAAALWRMRGAGPGSIDVITPRHRRCSARLQMHEVALAADEVTLERGIPVTTPARTLLDLAIVVGPEQLQAAFDQAEYRRLGSATSVETLLARYPGRPGTRPLRRVLEDHRRNGETVTRSLLERRLLALVAKHGLPCPRINRVGPEGELDARWPDQRLVVECDGFAAHGTRRAFEHDRARDRALQVAGWRVVRITWRQLTDDADVIARQLAALLR